MAELENRMLNADPDALDQSRPPALWPAVDREDLTVAPVFNETYWFALIKRHEPSALTDRQVDSLVKLGFKEGSQGRLICTQKIDPHLVEAIGRIVNAPLDVLTQEQMVFLKTAGEIKPAVPLEIQAGIRWFWKNRPQSLLTELQTALEEREDELSQQTLQQIENQRIYNALRIQRWVGLAISGEVSPVTEPILGLGLQKAAEQYGDFEQWPDELKSWHQKLAEERGNAFAFEEDSKATRKITADLTPDYRPEIGRKVSWTDDGRQDRGVVVDYDPNDKRVVWVSSASSQSTLNGIQFPHRKRLPIDAIHGVQIPEPGLTEKNTPTDRPQVVLAPVNPESLKPQPALTVSDLDPRYQALHSQGIAFSSEDIETLEATYRSGLLRGHSPLMPADANQPMVSYWYGLTRELISEHGSKGEMDASTFVRDLILEDFNRAQPMTPNGGRSVLAVFPLQSLGLKKHKDSETLQALEAMREQEFCQIGINPIHSPKIRDRLLNWSEAMDTHLEGKNADLLEALTEEASKLSVRTLDANALTLALPGERVNSIVNSIMTRADSPISDNATAAERLAFVKENTPSVLEKLQHMVFPTYEAAGNWINGLSPEITRVIESNEAILASLSDLTDTSPADIERTPHPVFAIIDELHNLGLPECSKAQALAMLNCDLRNHINWVGQMAALNGAEIPFAHTTTMRMEASEESAPLIRHSALKVDQAYTTTGWLQNRSESRPFQVSFVATAENLNLLADKLGGSTYAQSVVGSYGAFSQKDTGINGRHAEWHFKGLGRLIETHAAHSINFGSPFEGEIITDDALDELPMNIFTVNHLGLLDNRNGIPNIGLPVDRIQKLEESPTEPLGDLHHTTLIQHCQSARSGLLTLTPSWRTDTDKQNQMREAIRFWVADQNELKRLASPERIVDLIERSLVSDPDSEMVVLATKQTSRNIYRQNVTVTRKNILAANNDRSEAVERAVLSMKASDQSLAKGWKFAAFDAATVMRPHALRVLNERREQLRAELQRETRDDNLPKPARKRSARQDKGVVAGLSIKDLRGKTTTILSNLRHASRADQERYITKTKLWEAPDWTALRSPDEEARNNGERAMEPVVAAFFEQARKDLPSQPPANIQLVNEAYAEFMLVMRDALGSIRTREELESAILPDGVIGKAADVAKKLAKSLGIPRRLLLGPESDFHPMGMRWFRKAMRESLDNTHWPIETQKGSAGRKPGKKDLTGAMPMLDALVRSGGKDYRAGTDIDEQSIIATFGFSGVEYGKSMTQADRTEYLNQAYDGFMDLADALGVPPKALSLGGTLGLAFGSRGRGGRNAALAHFEPTNNVINLTRMKGAGSMAHEFGHGLANFFYRVSRGTPGDRSAGDITEVLTRQLEAQHSPHPKLNPGNLRNAVAEAIGVVMQTIRYTIDPKAKDEPYTLEETFQQGLIRSPLVKGAIRADGTRKKPYWKTPEELFARSFETWIHESLKRKYPGFQNDFLVRPDKLTAWGTPMDKQEGPGGSRPQLYPSGEQLESIHQAFSNLFRVVETQEVEVNHEHLGKVSLPFLYSHGSGSIERLSEREHQIVAECVLNEVARMCGDQVWVQWRQDLTDTNGNQVAGRYRELQGHNIERKVRGVIDLAYGSSISTAYHEAYHFAQSALVSGDEQAMMDREFSPGSELHQRLCRALEKDDKEHLIPHCNNPREGQAYAYELWVKGKMPMERTEQPTTIFARVKRFLGNIASMGRRAGFSQPEQLFQAFYSGQLAERAKANTQERANRSLSVPEADEQAIKDSVSASLDKAQWSQVEMDDPNEMPSIQ